MSRVASLAFRNRQVPGALPDLDSPTSSSGIPYPLPDDGVAVAPESSAEDTTNPPAPHTLLNDDPFSTDISKILFEAIDQLRKNGASQDLALPQLVIVGKQSAGKSSLLQSLTDIPFPVGNRLCTRFATRIVSKRSPPMKSDVVRASIEPGDVNPFNYSQDDVVTDRFPKILTSMSADEFENIATEEMGINSPQVPENRNFSSKVLKIELCGPKRSHFGILDVPGVFSSTTGGVTDEEMNGVTDMVTSYMKRPENIIILVGDATDDLANQSIFKLAETHNVHSSRIIAVFTKCDRVQVPKNVVQIVKDGDGIAGKDLRWYVVRNRDPTTSPSFNREEDEAALFSQGPWLEIPEEQRGTPNLKNYLGQLLCEQIREGFPALQTSVSDKLQEQETRLRGLGRPRGTFVEQQTYLRDIVKAYEDLAGKALRSPAELPCDELKLRGFTQNMNAGFAKMMVKEGHKYQFLDIGQDIEADWSREDSDSESETRTINVPMANLPPTPLTTPNRRRRIAAPARSSYSRQTTPQLRTISPLYMEIRKQIEANRGEELPGMLNPAVLKPLWVKQTSKWRELGAAHLKSIVDKTTDIAVRMLLESTKDIEINERTRFKFEKKILDDGIQAQKDVLTKLDALYHNNATQPLQTNNPQFETNVNAARAQRFKGALERYRNTNAPELFLNRLPIGPSATTISPDIYGRWTIVDDDLVTTLFNEIHLYGERAQNTQDEIHDLLKAYYDIALQNFLHDIETSIVEPFLQSKDGPLLGFSTDYILSLNDAEVEEFGGEDNFVVEQRKDARFERDRLRLAMEIADEALRKTREVEKVGA